MPSEPTNDVFSISDAALSEKLQFVEEIGSGNWGSVWLCKAKPEDEEATQTTRTRRTKVAVKLVHRAKTPTSPESDEDKKVADAASKRVKTLWSEMKIVRTLNEQPHPSIINFQSFIITPSFAMIAMPYLPQLIPVEVPEPRAKEWLQSLVSAVDFCHRRGIVHNDIKPANIMISLKNIPVLIDFGFAERYDATAKDAFISNLHYGTPEYIAPERAGGLPHDTRKADIWSLGVTLFEILVGRTPFEQGESEQFITTEDLKRYWLRTIQGKWVGDWTMSGSAENMLRRMLNPNADLRYTAADALRDTYWTSSDLTPLSPMPLAEQVPQRRTRPKHTKNPSVVEIISPWATRSMRGRGKENVTSAPKEKKLATAVSSPRLDLEKRRSGILAPSQVFKAPSMGKAEGKKRAPLVATHNAQGEEPSVQERTAEAVKAKRRSMIIAPLASAPAAKDVFADNMVSEDTILARRIVQDALATPLGSNSTRSGKPVKTTSRASKENLENAPAQTPPRSRKALGARHASSPAKYTTASQPGDYFTSKRTAIRPPSDDGQSTTAFRAALLNQPAVTRIAVNSTPEHDDDICEMPSTSSLNASVIRRMLDWEHERSQLKSILESPAKSPEQGQPLSTGAFVPRRPGDMASSRRSSNVLMPTTAQGSTSSRSGTMSPRSVLGKRGEYDEEAHRVPTPTDGSTNGSMMNLLKQSLRLPLSFAEQTFGNRSKRSTPALSVLEFNKQSPTRGSWVDEVIRAADNESTQLSPDEKEARMAEWARGVQSIVENAKANFEQIAGAGQPSVPTLLPPPPPVSRRVSLLRTPSVQPRMPRKMLAANQIFNDDASPNASFDTSGYGADMSTDMSSTSPMASPASANQSQAPTIAITGSPARPRRNTVATESPVKLSKLSCNRTPIRPSDEHWRSVGHHLQQHISPVAKLNFDLDHLADVEVAKPEEPRRLSAMIDSSVFIASPRARSVEILRTPKITVTTEDVFDDLSGSPFHVQPYPVRPRGPDAAPLPDTPTRIHAETVYDRFLMSTSAVKRVGSGYQSSAPAPSGSLLPDARAQRRSSRIFPSTRKPMLPAVSSEDVHRAASVDELGSIGRANMLSPAPSTEEPGVWRALKAATTRRISRVF